MIEICDWQNRDFSRELRQAARCDGGELVANRPRGHAIDLKREFASPWVAIIMRNGRERNDETWSVQTVLVGNNDNRPGFPHLRQLGVPPEIAPIDLPDFWRSFDARWNSGRLLIICRQNEPRNCSTADDMLREIPAKVHLIMDMPTTWKSLIITGDEDFSWPLEITGRMKPVHPGEIPREDFLGQLGISAITAAKACGVPRTRIESLVREETSVTADTALRLGKSGNVRAILAQSAKRI